MVPPPVPPVPKLESLPMMTIITAPDRTEAAEYYFTYIDQVGQGDIRQILAAQLPETMALLEGISDETSLYRYTPEKWTIRQVVGHMNDAERLFVFRAFWFARGHDSELPSFDQDIGVARADFDAIPWKDHIDEFRAVREATVGFFQNLPEEAWTRRGIASGNEVSVRALAYITAGHVAHHARILRERYV